MAELYRYVWKTSGYYGRVCQVVKRTNTKNMIVKFIDTNETAVVHQMSLRMLQQPINAGANDEKVSGR